MEPTKLDEIFSPDVVQNLRGLIENNSRFVHYASAETATKIIENSELWFRNSLAMNDFSEISYGLALFNHIRESATGQNLRDYFDSIDQSIWSRLTKHFETWETDVRTETYIACVSLHHPEEDKRGRLSMWRAYGNTAIVLKNTPVTQSRPELNVFGAKVKYWNKEEAERYFDELLKRLQDNIHFLKEQTSEELHNRIYGKFFETVIASKHPGFEEEQEWRFYYNPNQNVSPLMDKSRVIINGTPQIVYRLRLTDDPENGLIGADIPNLLDRIILGPCEFPYLNFKSFIELLDEKGVENPVEKVVFSDIPIRQRN